MSRTSSRRLASVFAITAIAAASIAVIAAPAQAAGVTITKVSPLKIATATKDAVVTITGTGFDSATIGQVDLGTNCLNAVGTKTSLIVLSPTTIVAKTLGVLCVTPTAGVTPESIQLYAANGTTPVGSPFVGTATTGLFFIAPPNFGTDAPTTPSAYLNASQALNASPATAAGQGRKVVLSAAGGQTIRVNGTGYAKGLTATLGGKALTAITLDTAATPLYFTAKTSAMSPGAQTLVLTANGVSKSFSTQLTVTAQTSVTSVSPTSVAVNSGATVTINGTNFSTVNSENTVTICGVAATVTGTSTKTKITVTLPTLAGVGSAVNPAGLGTSGFEGPCAVTVANSNAVAVAAPGSTATAYLANTMSVGSVLTVLAY
jgi:hypothetical protein